MNDDEVMMGKKGFSVTFSVLVDILNFGRFSFSGVLVGTTPQNWWLVGPNMVLLLWKNQSSDFKLVEFCVSGVLSLVYILEGLGSGA
jgi:hypothetical protein